MRATKNNMRGTVGGRGLREMPNKLQTDRSREVLFLPDASVGT